MRTKLAVLSLSTRFTRSIHNLKVRVESNRFLESFSIFDPKVLKNLYVKGYTSIVLKILVQLLRFLESSSSQIVTLNTFTPA